MSEALKTELETFERHRTELLAQGEGKYALLQGDRVAGVWDTYEDALRAGYKTFGLTPFLVKQILRMETAHYFTREVGTCPS